MHPNDFTRKRTSDGTANVELVRAQLRIEAGGCLERQAFRSSDFDLERVGPQRLPHVVFDRLGFADPHVARCRCTHGGVRARDAERERVAGVAGGDKIE